MKGRAPLSLISRYDQAMMAAYGLPPLAISHGHGATLVDVEGNSYLDLDAGNGANSLGYAHPGLTAAIASQAAKAIHVSTSFATEPQVMLAERLQACLTDEGYVGASSRIFFTNSGSEAIAAAITMARLRKPGGRVLFVEGSYQATTPGGLFADIGDTGATVGDMAIEHVAAEIPALEDAFAADVAALVMEPFLCGEQVVAVDGAVLRRARDLCDLHGALLIIDEAQSGIGRTGRWFAHANHVKADVITLGKGLGGGVPIGATIGLQRAGRLIQTGHESVTTGGNPLATASALTVINTVAELNAQIRDTGEWLTAELSALGLKVSGSGLLLAIEVDDAASLTQRLRESGFIVAQTGSRHIRLTPPLIITADLLTDFVASLAKETV